MRTSARNELNGVIKEIKSGGVMSEVIIEVDKNITISSTITNDSKDAMVLKNGMHISALIKASMLVLSKEKLSTSARNNIEAKVVEVIKGAINSEIKLKLGEVMLYAIITNDALLELNIKKDDTIYAIFKASSVILVA